MFTGLIQSVCPVKSVGWQSVAGSMRLGIELAGLAGETKIGDSIAVNGVCLTVTALEGNTAFFDVSDETLSKSTIGALRPPDLVNIELALKCGDRLGGHFVLGHIDGTGTIKAIQRRGRFADIEFAVGPDMLEYMVAKGSVAVDGVSLTVAELAADGFTAAIIPQTLQSTTFGRAKPGQRVNIEIDVIAKIIKRQLDRVFAPKESLTIEKLEQMGF